MYVGPIADPHVHIFNLETLSYPWLKGPHQVGMHIAGNLDPIRKSYSLTDLQSEMSAAAGGGGGGRPRSVVQRFVHVQAECASGGEAEVAMVQSVADEHDRKLSIATDRPLSTTGGVFSPTSIGIVAHAHFHDPTGQSDAQFTEYISRLSQYRSVRGIRQLLNYHPTNPALNFTTRPDWMSDDPVWIRRFGEALIPRNWSFDLQIYTEHQLTQAMSLIKRYPSIQFIVNHGGMPIDGTDSVAVKRWSDSLIPLGRQPNVAIKLSGIAMVNHHLTSHTVLLPYVVAVLEAFGTSKILWASNYPIDKIARPNRYDASVDFMVRSLLERQCSTHEIEQIMYANAIRIYRLAA